MQDMSDEDKKRKRDSAKVKQQQQSLEESFGVLPSKKLKSSPVLSCRRPIYIQKGRSWGPVVRAWDRKNWTRFWLDKGMDSWVDAFFLPEELIISKGKFMVLSFFNLGFSYFFNSSFLIYPSF